MGSFVPWLYYGFYCHYEHKLIYLSVVVVLGIVSIVVSLWDKFSEPNLRPLRAGMSEPNRFNRHGTKKGRKKPFVFTQFLFEIGAFMSFGLSGVIPAIHYGLMEGWFSKISQASLGWLVLMGKSLLHFHFTFVESYLLIKLMNWGGKMFAKLTDTSLLRKTTTVLHLCC